MFLRTRRMYKIVLNTEKRDSRNASSTIRRSKINMGNKTRHLRIHEGTFKNKFVPDTEVKCTVSGNFFVRVSGGKTN